MANYKISDVEGIGPKFAVKLSKAGVRSVNALLENGASKKDRKVISRKNGH